MPSLGLGILKLKAGSWDGIGPATVECNHRSLAMHPQPGVLLADWLVLCCLAPCWTTGAGNKADHTQFLAHSSHQSG